MTLPDDHELKSVILDEWRYRENTMTEKETNGIIKDKFI